MVEDLEIKDIKFVAIFDRSAQANMTAYDLLWLAMANSDPRRDVTLCGSTLVVDARSKEPNGDGNPARFPNVVTSLMEIIELVDSRWQEYGLGDFVGSPSRKYRELLLSDKEDW